MTSKLVFDATCYHGSVPQSVFPLRFEEESIRRALKEVSEQTGVSMNRLAQEAIAVQLHFATRVLEARMQEAIEDLRGYRGAWSDHEIQAFAHAEADHPDPVEGRMIEETKADPFSSVVRLADTVE